MHGAQVFDEVADTGSVEQIDEASPWLRRLQRLGLDRGHPARQDVACAHDVRIDEQIAEVAAMIEAVDTERTSQVQKRRGAPELIVEQAHTHAIAHRRST